MGEHAGREGEPSPAEQALREAALEYHRHPVHGKISIAPTKPLSNQRDLSLAYSPGVAYACLAIADDPECAAEYTSRSNLVGVVTNGTAVLGLGDIGPLASKPVMEGKGCLFKKFAGIDVFDIELDERDPDKLVDIVAALEPTLGGINLEDIKAPECFTIERKLRERMNIPVFHDDQHGTAIISAAALLNGLELVGKDIGAVKVAVSGAGAAAIACLDVFVGLGVLRERIFIVDSKGVVRAGRDDFARLDESKLRYCQKTEARTLADVVKDADVFLGCSAAGVLTGEMVKTMAARPLILALANPEPEIRPEAARAARADCIVATGRSDYPNQVNNVLCFPYIFRGALDCGATKITEAMKLAAVREIAALAKAEISDEVAGAYAGQDLRFGADYIIPTPFDSRLILRIAPAVARAAAESGVATRPIADLDAYRQSLTRFVYHTGMLMQPVFAAAKANPVRVVYAEGEDERVLRAVQVVRDEGLAKPILVGRPEVVKMRIERASLRLAAGRDFTLVDPENDPRFREYWELYAELMGREGITPEAAKAAVRRSNTLDLGADGAPGRGRGDAVRAGGPLRPSPGARAQRDRPEARRAHACDLERGDAAAAHTVSHRHLRQRGAERRGTGRHRPDRGRRGAALRHPAARGVPVAQRVRQQPACQRQTHARGTRPVRGASTAHPVRRGDAGRRRVVGVRAPGLSAGHLADRRGQPARDAQPRRRQHPVQCAEDDRWPRHHDRAAAARRRQGCPCAHAQRHGAPGGEHDGAGGGRPGREIAGADAGRPGNQSPCSGRARLTLPKSLALRADEVIEQALPCDVPPSEDENRGRRMRLSSCQAASAGSRAQGQSTGARRMAALGRQCEFRAWTHRSIWEGRRPATPPAPPPLACRRSGCILNYMVQYCQARFDASFAALSDVTRRGVLEQLGGSDASITDLAEKFHMTLTGMKKHVSVLEQAGLVTTEKVGRVRTCKLGLRRLEEEAAWIERYHQLWDARFDELDRVVAELKRKEKVDGRKQRR